MISNINDKSSVAAGIVQLGPLGPRSFCPCFAIIKVLFVVCKKDLRFSLL